MFKPPGITTEKNREMHPWITIILHRNNLHVITYPMGYTRPIKHYLVLTAHNIKYTLVHRISKNVRKF